jgi:hypothetical protein
MLLAERFRGFLSCSKMDNLNCPKPDTAKPEAVISGAAHFAVRH